MLLKNPVIASVILCIVCIRSIAQSSQVSVVVLGVTHSAQLINEHEQPAALRAFIRRVNPDAICIERSPERYERNDYYEFTYEQQQVVVPFARRNKIPVFPIDWLPPEEDMRLAFGTADLEVPPFTRNPSGFWGFLKFEDSSILREDFYFAEDSLQRKSNSAWYMAYPESQVNTDFARRLFLYRTFMQAKRISAVASNMNSGDTILVVIGSLHKDDIERELRSSGIKVIPADKFGQNTTAEIQSAWEINDAFAIASFNLLGVQSLSNFTRRNPLLKEAMTRLNGINSNEVRFLEVKYDLLTGKIGIETTLQKYKEILRQTSSSELFSWNGVKSKSRLDSYFDPFGNLSVRERLQLEIARCYFLIGSKTEAAQEKERLLANFSGIKKAMLMAYWTEYIGN